MDENSINLPQTKFIDFTEDISHYDSSVYEKAQIDDLIAVQNLPNQNAFLIVEKGPSSGARFLLDKDIILIGRSTKSDIFLDDVTVSRKHCQIIVEDGERVVRDCGSLNGTYVNRNRVESAVLEPGDEIQIGKYRLTYSPSPHRLRS